MNISEEKIQDKLCRLFTGSQWEAPLTYNSLKKKHSTDACTNSNIIAILKKCDITNDLLNQHINTAIENSSIYKKGDLYNFEPLKDGEPTFLNSKILGRFVDISPDADDNCLVQIVIEDSEGIDSLIENLIFYRLDNRKFSLMKNQRDKLSGTDNTFLTWFPRKEKCHDLKLETIDIAVNANILWFLGKTGNLSIPGAEETIKLIANTVNSEIILRDPFVVSPYYPFPAIILYKISRGIVFGKIDELYGLKDKILAQNDACEIKSTLDALCVTSTNVLWGRHDPAQNGFGNLALRQMTADVVFVAHFFLGRSPLSFDLSRKSVFQLKYRCEALQWAMLLWIRQQLHGRSGTPGEC